MTTNPTAGDRIDDFYGAGDPSLVRLKIPDGIAEVGQGAFSDLPNLVSATFPDSVRIIGSCAFQRCPHLEEVRLPAALSEVRGAFAETGRLRRVRVNAPMRMEGALLLRGDTLLRAFASMLDGPRLRLPDGVRHIAGGALAGCVSLEEVELPDGLETIGGGAFAGCGGLVGIRLPDSVRRILGSAFAGASRLKELVLPDTVEEVGEWCCDGCASLRRVEMPGRLRCPANAFPPSCEWRRRAPAAPAEGTPPEAGRREIPPYAFAESDALADADLPDSVERIGQGAFQRCPNLRSVRLPRGLKLIERNAFASLPRLEEIDVPEGVAEIPQGCFWNCASLRRIRLPASLRTINRYAFRDCPALEEMELPEGLETLVSGAFLGCRALRRVSFPESLKTIGSGDYLTPDGVFPGTFEGCESLVGAHLPNALRFLGDRSFLGCSALRRIRLPEALERRGRDVFAGCPPDLSVDAVPPVSPPLPAWAETVLRHDAEPLGFLFALGEEATPFARRLGLAGDVVPGRVHLLGRHRLLVCGAGRANAAAGTIRLAREGCRTIVDIGLCGASGIPGAVGRVFVPETCWDGDVHSQNPGEDLLDPARVNDGLRQGEAPPIYTVSGFATDVRAPAPVLVDNEAYAVAAAAAALGIRRLFVKVVSDLADGGARTDFSRALRAFGDRIDEVGARLAALLQCRGDGDGRKEGT